MKRKPVRTCCSCRKKILKTELIRFVWDGSAVQIDTEQKKPGRGAYCCKNGQCDEIFSGHKKKWKKLFRL